MSQDVAEKGKVLARELKEDMLKEKSEVFHVIGFTENWKNWWHVHEDEEVPEHWMLKPVLS